jgi:hypothetical protein
VSARYEKFDAELAAGRLWRAKEMLAGRLRDADYDAQLFERYGKVLHLMQDDDAAGQYFFLAGISAGPDGDLAKAFLRRRSKRSLPDIWDSMPRSARALRTPESTLKAQALLASVDRRPEDVHKFFEGLRRELKARDRRALRQTSPPSRMQKFFAGLFAIVALAVFISSVIALARLIERVISGLF